MNGKGNKRVLIAIAAVLSLVLGIVIFLCVPFSPAKAAFERTVDEAIQSEAGTPEKFSEADLAELPAPVQEYFRYCGYLGAPKMSYMTASFADVDFVMSEDRTIMIDYQQLNTAHRPERFALISSSVFGIPFEGLDSFKNGKGSMKGTLAKVIPLFDQRGESMDRACLVTWLAECLLVPNAALQEFVVWEGVDDARAKATVTWEGISVSGVFTFAQNGELLSFLTGDRVAVDMEGNETEADWSAYFREYHSVEGILQPKILLSVWHYQSGDVVYFNENESAVTIRYH